MTTTYAEFAPTGFDRSGAFLPDRQDWLVVPCGRNRDSGPLAESNFATALDSLGGESDTVEVHRFGHWACGWFEIILASPEHTDDVEDIENSLADYPVLNDEDYSEREYTAAVNYWASMSVSERVDYCRKWRISRFAARRDELPQDAQTSDLMRN
jgi:hypothetical protein